MVARAMSEVYEHPDWETLYTRLYGEHVPDPHFTASVEKDGSPRGYGGEGRYHRALRCWVLNHPERIHARFRDARTKTEDDLLSGDRVDVVYYTDEEVLAIEVKSRVSSWEDLRRGIYQCVKYRAVLAAQERQRSTVRTLLVTESGFPSDLAGLAKELNVPHLCVGLRGS